LKKVIKNNQFVKLKNAVIRSEIEILFQIVEKKVDFIQKLFYF